MKLFVGKGEERERGKEKELWMKRRKGGGSEWSRGEEEGGGRESEDEGHEIIKRGVRGKRRRG